jgi:DNA-binding MarR family transcriptional regulator
MNATARIDQRTTLVHDALHACLTVVQTLLTATTGAWLQLDLSTSELKALLAVVQQDGLTIGGLAVLLGVSRPEASRVADQLYRRGLITRVEDPADRRRSLLGLTRTGHDVVGALFQGDQSLLASSLTHLETAELQQLVQGLRTLLALPRSSPKPSAISRSLPRRSAVSHPARTHSGVQVSRPP